MLCQTAAEQAPAAHHDGPVIAVNYRTRIRDGPALSGEDKLHGLPIDAVAEDSLIAIQLAGNAESAIVMASLQDQVCRIAVVTIPRFAKRQDRALCRDDQGGNPVDVHAVDAADE